VRLRAVGAGADVTSGTQTVSRLTETVKEALVVTKRKRYTPGRWKMATVVTWVGLVRVTVAGMGSGVRVVVVGSC
jgi:hypothetical protein